MNFRSSKRPVRDNALMEAVMMKSFCMSALEINFKSGKPEPLQKQNKTKQSKNQAVPFHDTGFKVL